jgi:hypothetical protein
VAASKESRAGAHGRDDRPAGRGAERERRVAGDREVAVGLLEQIRSHDFAGEPERSRRIERDCCTAARLEHDELPHLCVPGHEQHSRHGAHGEASAVGRDHDEAAREAVADDAAEGEGRHLGDRPRREAQAHCGCAPAEVEHGERDGDRGEVRPDVGDPSGREEEPEVTVVERLHDRMFAR